MKTLPPPISDAAVQLDLLQRDWCERMEGIVLLTMRGRTFTSDDLHGVLDTPEHPNWWGVLLARMKNKGLVQRIGYQPSTRKAANGRPIALWGMLE